MRSSRRFKKNIQPITTESAGIMRLRPVSFSWRSESDGDIQWGLIAEEVYEIFPDLVEYDDNSLPFSVKYDQLSVLLLNEFKKMQNRIATLERAIGDLKRVKMR